MAGVQDIYQTAETVGKILDRSNTILKEKNEVGGLTLPYMMIYYKGIVVKTV